MDQNCAPVLASRQDRRLVKMRAHLKVRRRMPGLGRDRGSSPTAMSPFTGPGIMMPVMSLQMRYVRPALYDELLTIRTTLRQLPESTMTFHHEIFNEKKKLVNGGSVKLCFVDMKTGRTVPPPQYLIDKLTPHFQLNT